MYYVLYFGHVYNLLNNSNLYISTISRNLSITDVSMGIHFSYMSIRKNMDHFQARHSLMIQMMPMITCKLALVSLVQEKKARNPIVDGRFVTSAKIDIIYTLSFCFIVLINLKDGAYSRSHYILYIKVKVSAEFLFLYYV